jgi:hypothetical protein
MASVDEIRITYCGSRTSLAASLFLAGIPWLPPPADLTAGPSWRQAGDEFDASVKC